MRGSSCCWLAFIRSANGSPTFRSVFLGLTLGWPILMAPHSHVVDSLTSDGGVAWWGRHFWGHGPYVFYHCSWRDVDQPVLLDCLFGFEIPIALRQICQPSLCGCKWQYSMWAVVGVLERKPETVAHYLYILRTPVS